jgi:predicted PurR-regulated permease PerM
MWGPAVAGGLVLGPVGALLGAIASVVIVASGSAASREGEDQSKHK